MDDLKYGFIKKTIYDIIFTSFITKNWYLHKSINKVIYASTK